MQLDVQNYWNKVERALGCSQPNRIVDNFVKRRLLLEALLKYPLAGARIVELGSGLGLTAYAVGLINGCIKYTGVDISQSFSAAAKHHFGLNVVVCDITDGLPFPDGAADIIFAFDTLEHIQPEKRPALFKEMDRILNKKDRAIFINNPLNESKHDPRYDFTLEEKEIGELAAVTNTRILEMKILQQDSLAYQFVAMGNFKTSGVKP